MSDLTTFRDHCRKQAEIAASPRREQWTALADELDAYLHRDEVVDLFGDAAVEPEAVEL